MRTTASRSCEWLRKNNWMAEVVEHRQGSFIRKDLFDVADVLAFRKDKGILLVQAYDRYSKEEHSHLNAEHPVIKNWIECGGTFQHHIWSKLSAIKKDGKKGHSKKWNVEVIFIKPRRD